MPPIRPDHTEANPASERPRQSRGVIGLRPSVVMALAGALLAPARGFAAVTITSQKGARPATTVYADGDRLRVDNPAREAGGRATTILLDAAGKRFVTLDESNKTYTEVTEEDMKRMRGQMDAMRAQMQDRLKSMPPEQRKKMEELMGQRGGAMGGSGSGGASKPREWTFESLGQKKTINGFSCELFRVNVDGKPREEDCISPWSAGLVKREDFSGLQKFGEEMSKQLGGGDGERASGPFLRFDKAPGLPISRVPIESDGKRGEEEQIKTIKRGAIAPALFAIPTGFTKKELPVGPLGPGGARHHGPGAAP